ncbi:MAG: aspartate carbamoyltransferase catalytic subunit [Clostridiaceae bacterium]|jgi:aspartate carbamoyltransferase catalytic subunit|nr:aspartate carbamoyltransferase catalytic subunit [Clostridiaceae bacterium]
MGKNLLELKSLDVSEIRSILDQAQAFHDGQVFRGCEGRIAANLFFEPSTRTQYSFHVAEEKLGLRVVSFNPAGSSLQKNESFYDTVKTFDSFGVDLLVIRHVENEYYNQLTGRVNAKILNGGDGTGNHPTQSLLDLLTIRQQFGGFEGLKVAIIGDVSHSRVAHTNFEVMGRLGMEVCTSGPEEYMEEGMNFKPFEQAVRESDVVMLLRVQHERHSQKMGLTVEEYHKKYGMDKDKLSWLKKDAILMHPAPFNRGVEIADEVVECDRSRIFKQMNNGVFVRMAAIQRALCD